MEKGRIPYEGSSPPDHRSLALPQLFDHLRRRQRPRILDLGPATGENVAFLSTLPARLHIADLPQTLAEAAGGSGVRGGAALASLIERDLPPIEPGSIDAVFAWDLLNYLDPPAIEALGRRLAAFCRPDALMLALISTLRQIPDRPQQFRIAGPDRLVYYSASAARRPGPQYNEPDLCRWLPAFEVDTSFLLRHGMKEYLFALRPTAPSLPRSGAAG